MGYKMGHFYNGYLIVSRKKSQKERLPQCPLPVQWINRVWSVPTLGGYATPAAMGAAQNAELVSEDANVEG